MKRLNIAKMHICKANWEIGLLVQPRNSRKGEEVVLLEKPAKASSLPPNGMAPLRY